MSIDIKAPSFRNRCRGIGRELAQAPRRGLQARRGDCRHRDRQGRARGGGAGDARSPRSSGIRRHGAQPGSHRALRGRRHGRCAGERGGACSRSGGFAGGPGVAGRRRGWPRRARRGSGAGQGQRQGGRITREDVLTHAQQAPAPAAPAAATPAAAAPAAARAPAELPSTPAARWWRAPRRGVSSARADDAAARARRRAPARCLAQHAMLTTFNEVDMQPVD